MNTAVIHRSAWKGLSPELDFRFTAFQEVLRPRLAEFRPFGISTSDDHIRLGRAYVPQVRMIEFCTVFC